MGDNDNNNDRFQTTQRPRTRITRWTCSWTRLGDNHNDRFKTTQCRTRWGSHDNTRNRHKTTQYKNGIQGHQKVRRIRPSLGELRSWSR